MGKQFEVYLAGGIAGLSCESTMQSRLVATEKLEKVGIKCLNPLRGRSNLTGKKMASEGFRDGLTIQEIIARDLHDINRCNALLVLTGNTPSWGTGFELAYATWVVRKPTVVITSNDVGGWLEYFATRRVKNIDEAVEVLEDWTLYWDGEGVYDKR